MKTAGDLVGRIAAIQEKAKQQNNHALAPIASLKSNVVQLPMWPDMVRGVPNAALRSALFGAIKRGARSYLERQEIHAQEGVKIIYTGARLDQGDLDVWEAVLHVVRMQELGDECRVTAYQLLKILGKTDTGINRDTLERRLSRMKATGVDVSVGRYGYEGSLIDEVYRDKETREYIIRLNPKLSALFAADQFTQVDWNVRRALDGKPMAQWLHGFYASHAKPFPLKVETLHRLCGSEAKRMSDYKIDLRRNLEAVTEASAAYDEGFSYDICGDLVYVEKKASGPQRRHLTKKGKQ
ncbi:MAG: TrfA protein [Rhodoferax sp.]|nr:TrfA protein [Rhodoferax sp.]